MLLSVKNLHVSYGHIKALQGISFDVDKGEIICIIGANGAGKSTTLRAISRLVPVQEGDILFTRYGLSGFAVLDLSHQASKALSEYAQVSLTLDLLPTMHPQ